MFAKVSNLLFGRGTVCVPAAANMNMSIVSLRQHTHASYFRHHGNVAFAAAAAANSDCPHPAHRKHAHTHLRATCEMNTTTCDEPHEDNLLKVGAASPLSGAPTTTPTRDDR